ncbi:MAG: hypothetical protein ACRDL8_19335 [Solirubrobacteraceae bacterium]
MSKRDVTAIFLLVAALNLGSLLLALAFFGELVHAVVTSQSMPVLGDPAAAAPG